MVIMGLLMVLLGVTIYISHQFLGAQINMLKILIMKLPLMMAAVMVIRKMAMPLLVLVGMQII